LRVFYEVDAWIESLLVYLKYCLLIEPLNSLASFPKPIFDAVFRAIGVGAKSMLLALVPPALVLAPIRPVVNTVTFLLIIFVLSIVPDSIRVDIDTETMHVVGTPLTIVGSAIVPQVYSVAVYFVVQPLPVIG
jgi:hypothetical protein